MVNPNAVYNEIRNKVGAGDLTDQQLRAVADAIAAYLSSNSFKQLVRSIVRES